MQTGCGSRNRDALSGKELWIDWDLQRIGKSIRLRGRAYDRQELRILRIGKSLGTLGSRDLDGHRLVPVELEPDDEIARVGMVTPADPNRIAFCRRHSVYIDPHGCRRPSGEDEGGIEHRRFGGSLEAAA